MANNKGLAIRFEHISKQYRLGKIGGGTLQGDIQSWWAKLRGHEDPNTKIGSKQHLRNKRFLALDDINLEIAQGEVVGIIGHNGAGKSTLLKLLSRVTAPTAGNIYINGRITSMLEVGTGFHPEMTGRENIYMNGSILGMTKKEIDTKVEEIIDFSECREFIDTPVKRYSSGMYVKLAFSVAAHLDSEIMVMDEVLAVGDISFQQKCLKRMGDASDNEGKTVLYVSHNMNTIRQLCKRCIVLNHGHIVFDGDSEEAISRYIGIYNKTGAFIDLAGIEREKWIENGCAKMQSLLLENTTGTYQMNSKMRGKLKVICNKDVANVILGIFFHYHNVAVTSMKSDAKISLKKDSYVDVPFEVDLDRLAPGKYTTKIVLSLQNDLGNAEYLDTITHSYAFEIIQSMGYMNNLRWNIQLNGYLTGAKVKLLQ